MILIFRSKRARILIALFSTVFVVLSSMMTFQNLSAGSHQGEEETEEFVPVEESPSPDPYEEDIVPNGEEAVEERMLLTNGQKYYKELVAPGSTNILLLGTDPTGFNFDTITVLNIDKTNKKVGIISFPRDIYIDYTDEIVAAVKKVKPYYPDEKGFNRINAAPSIGDTIKYKNGTGRFNKPYVDFLADLIEEVFSIHVADYAYVKVNGFRKIVDYFGGVTVYVPILMNYSDPSQDLEIYIEKGTQHLNGREAEGYIRFRQGYDENGVFHNYGDLFRKENQNRFIKAFIQQHVTLKNLSKLSKIAEIISSNVITSVKGWNDIVEYGALAEEALNNKYPIENIQLEISDKTIKGSSYVIIKTKD